VQVVAAETESSAKSVLNPVLKEDIVAKDEPEEPTSKSHVTVSATEDDYNINNTIKEALAVHDSSDSETLKVSTVEPSTTKSSTLLSPTLRLDKTIDKIEQLADTAEEFLEHVGNEGLSKLELYADKAEDFLEKMGNDFTSFISSAISIQPSTLKGGSSSPSNSSRTGSVKIPRKKIVYILVFLSKSLQNTYCLLKFISVDLIENLHWLPQSNKTKPSLPKTLLRSSTRPYQLIASSRNVS
jgi:hypothetical protein